MGKVLSIKNQELRDILHEGAALIDRAVLTGFNFDEETALSQLALVVQYYHNVEEHIAKFLNKLEEVYSCAFKQAAQYELAKKCPASFQV